MKAALAALKFRALSLLEVYARKVGGKAGAKEKKRVARLGQKKRQGWQGWGTHDHVRAPVQNTFVRL
jgi:hypothetical protein